MISKLLVLKNEKIRKTYNDFYIHHVFLKSCITNFFFSKKIFYNYANFFFSLLYFTKINHYCLLTYRRRGISSYFRLTRMMFKYYAISKYLSGIKKASW